MTNKVNLEKVLTSSGVCGATSEPTRPTAEQMECMELRVYVGNSSDVYMYTMLYEKVARASNAMKRARPTQAYPRTRSMENFDMILHEK